MGELTPQHRAELEAHAIRPWVYEAVVSASETGRGLLFRWFDGETEIYQGRVDPDKRTADGPKYLWPAGASPVINRLREPTEGKPILLVEGTCQHLAVASWADEVGVYGLMGCWGWSGCDLSWAEGRDVVVAFDADLTRNRDVYDAAVALGQALDAEGASSVKFIRPPGRANEGLDDVLARRDTSTRAAYLARLVEKASEKLGRAPARKSEVKVDAVAAEIMRAQPVALTGENRVAVYRDGAYRLDPAAFNAVAAQVLGEDFWPTMVDATEKYLAGLLYTDGQRIVERPDEPLLNVANGMLDLVTGELKDHDPAHLSARQIPVAWHPDATCPRYEAWLAEQIPDQVDDLEEVAATMLDPTRTPPKALFAFGPSRSGKSTFLRLMKAVAGPGNTSAVTLHQLSTNRFMAANVYEKILNCAADLSSAHVENLSQFKMLTGEDLIQADRKYGRQFSFTNRALFAFSANELPTVGESSRAYSERIKPFRFGRSFAGREDPAVEAAMMAELPGILVRWVRAWRRLRERGGYLPTDPGVAHEFETRSDRVRQWVSEACRIVTRVGKEAVSPGAYLLPKYVTTKRDLARSFNRWAEANQTSKMGERKIIDRLTSINGVYTVCRKDTKTRGLNVIIKPEEEWGAPAEEAEEAEEAVSAYPFLVCDYPLPRTHSSEQDQVEESQTRKGCLKTASSASSAAASTGNQTGVSGSYTVTLGDREALIFAPQAGHLDVEAFQASFPSGGLYGLDVEGTRLDDLGQWSPDFTLRLIQFATVGYAWVLNLSDPDQRAAAIELLRDPTVTFCSHTNMDVLSVALQLGVDITARNIDTRQLAVMAAPDDRLGGNDLKTLTNTYLGPQLAEAEQVLHERFRHLWPGRKNAKKADVEAFGWANIPSDDPSYVVYAGLDAVACRRLVDCLIPATGAPASLLQVEVWLAAEANRIQLRGMRVDRAALDALHAEAVAETTAAEAIIKEIANGIPARSPKLADWFGLHGADWSHHPRTDTGRPCLDKLAVRLLAGYDLDPDARTVAEQLVRFKAHQDALNKTTGILSHLTSDGRLHPALNTVGTVTGRMSSSGPNFQNFSKSDPRLRGLFLPDEGHVLVTADFDQVELRVVAALAREQKMIEVIRSGGDLHQLTADEVGISRDLAKMTNFLIVYGGGGKALHEQAGVPLEDAQEIVSTFRARYPAINELARQMSRMDPVRTVSHRRVPVTRNKTGDPRFYANINYLVQSSARDLLVDAWHRFAVDHGRADMVWFPIHDELVLHVPEDLEEQVKAEVEQCMNFSFLGVPISATAVTLRDANGQSRWMTSKHAEKVAHRGR